MVPLWVFDHPLVTGTCLRVYVGLAALAHDRSARCSTAAIVARSEIQKSAVYDALKVLEGLGAITREGKETWFLPLDPDSATTEKLLEDSATAETDSATAETHLYLLNNTRERPSSDASGVDPTNRFSEDVSRLCVLLADLVEANGSKRPTVAMKWMVECDRLIRLDGRTAEQIEKAIRWCQHDTFWRANILSMPKLREKYDQLRLAAQREKSSRSLPADVTTWTTSEKVKL